MADYDKVKEFHTKFAVPHDENFDGPYLPSRDVLSYRYKFLKEELDEFESACLMQNPGDLPEAVDALVDLVYVAYGTALMFGISPACWQELFDDVQRANMSKERATGPDDPRSKRGNALDVVKPEGWVGPRGADILARYKK